MWIQTRSMDGKTLHKVDGLSKLTTIEELRKHLIEPYNAQPDQQRLFYRGKQLEDEHTLFDYGVRQNDLIQIMVRACLLPPISLKDDIDSEKNSGSDKENVEPSNNGSRALTPAIDANSAKFKLGDILDARDPEVGSWYEAHITRIAPATDNFKLESAMCSRDESNESSFPRRDKADDYAYYILYDGYEDDDETVIRSHDLRPRARNIIEFKEVKTGDKVMINYNIDNPTQRGFWYDAIVTGKKDTRATKQLYCTVYFGADLTPLHDCSIVFMNEIFAIEPDDSQKNVHLDGIEATPTKRTHKPDCEVCLDNPRKRCKVCACISCGSKDNPNVQIICDECNDAWHIYCLRPPLEEVPNVDEWYCPLCKNDETEVVRAGEKLKASKKKAKMASASGKKSRDWGKIFQGMATVGRTTVCTIVPSNHFGPIPGVEVGAMWMYRVQVSEAGVHRPHVAGIAARENEGAFSIVLSGGYEDDVGSGGRDLSGNKRTAEQSSDQKLTKSNLGLARNCDAPVNNKNGAEAKNWRDGKPVRVVRNCKLFKHSKYAPEEGNRYDGIYKLVKYWPDKGQSGFLVWRYLFRRDDPAPAPWTKAGKKRVEELGLTMQYPEGFGEKKKGKSEQKKRENGTNDEQLCSKRSKVLPYKAPPDVAKHMELDEANRKLWDDAMSYASEGTQTLLAKVQELFACICCQDLVYQPVTTECRHNLCKDCIQRSFKASVYTCPSCRYDLDKDNSLEINKHLSRALLAMFPGYGSGRTQSALTFPSSRKALWCHAALGETFSLAIPRLSVSITEQVLYLAYGHSRSGKEEVCTLCGDAKVDADCSGIILLLDQFDASDNPSDQIATGSVSVVTRLTRNSRHVTFEKADENFIQQSLEALTDHTSNGAKIDLTNYLSASGRCTVFGGSNQIHCDMDVDLIVPNSSFSVTPIEPVSIAMTALSKSITSSDKHGIVHNQAKSGYLTMDQYRKVIFLLETDPKIMKVPIIGIWVSGVDLVTDPYLWACCVRYMQTKLIKDRVNRVMDPFLLIHKSPLMSDVQFFDCVPDSSALGFSLSSGSNGFSMDKTTSCKRKGLLSVRLEEQNALSIKGQQLLTQCKTAQLHMDKENVNIHAKQDETGFESDEFDDSVPQSSPAPLKNFTKPLLTPSVPDVSILDDSSPLEAPKPERRALSQVSDHRLNRSPNLKASVTAPFNKDLVADTSARNITFDSHAAPGNSLSHKRAFDRNEVSTSPSFQQAYVQPRTPVRKSSVSTATTNSLTTAQALDLSFNQSSIKSPAVAKLMPYSLKSQGSPMPQTCHSATNRTNPTNSRIEATQHALMTPQNGEILHKSYNIHDMQSIPNNNVICQPPSSLPCQCHCQYQQRETFPMQLTNSLSASSNSNTSLSIIASNVQRFLNSKTQGPAVTSAGIPTYAKQEDVPSPSDSISHQHHNIHATPLPTPTHNNMLYSPIPPEVQRILQEQNHQLKALQRQIQKLSRTQETKKTTVTTSTQTQTLPQKMSTTVNTGASLLDNASDHIEQQSSIGVDGSANNSSTAQSLIQHDLTTLDLPTLATARSFASDINIEYESYEDSQTGSPKHDSCGTASEASWQSPVLGESVSMIADNNSQETDREQLNLIVKNVCDLLAKQAPESLVSSTKNANVSQTVVTNELNSGDRTSSPMHREEVREVESINSENVQDVAADADEVASATRRQLRKMGVEVTSPSKHSELPVGLPRLQYISMLMSDSLLSDTNKSMELNALALKYLQDDQLTELAHFVVHKNSQETSSQTSLLRQVLTLNNTRNMSHVSGARDISFATHQYLRRYALTDASLDSDSIQSASSVPRVLEDVPPINLKSILRHTPVSQGSVPGKPAREKDSDDDTARVLDIDRLRELPKLL